MNAAETPGAAEERVRFGCGVIFVKPIAPAARIDFAFECGTQEIEHARHGDEESGAFAFDGTENFTGIGGVFEDYRGAEQRRDEERHELSEDVTERNERVQAERMELWFVFEIC